MISQEKEKNVSYYNIGRKFIVKDPYLYFDSGTAAVSLRSEGEGGPGAPHHQEDQHQEARATWGVGKAHGGGLLLPRAQKLRGHKGIVKNLEVLKAYPRTSVLVHL